MSTDSVSLNHAAVAPFAPSAPARLKTGIFKRNVRRAEREMFVRAELVFMVRERYPLVMNLLTVGRTVSKLITGL